jgi:hypothetical protein
MNLESTEAGRLIAEARLALDQTHSLLIEPTTRNIEIATTALARAIARIESLHICFAEKRCVPAGLLDSARGLREGIAGIALLLEHAAAYHANLLQTMIEADRRMAPPPLPLEMGPRVQLHA